MIKAIIFDVDGVLVDSKHANVTFFLTLLEKAGYKDTSYEEAASCFHLPLRGVVEKLTKSKDSAEIERVYKIGHDNTLRNSDLLKFPEELENVLEQLHKKYKLAIVTSRMEIGMEHLFGVRELRHFFDVIVTFEDYANPKPHPEPLNTALKKLGIEPDEAIYIGDSHTDIEAADAAGLRSIFLSREHNPKATVRIEEFNDLLEALRRLL